MWIQGMFEIRHQNWAACISWEIAKYGAYFLKFKNVPIPIYCEASLTIFIFIPI